MVAGVKVDETVDESKTTKDFSRHKRMIADLEDKLTALKLRLKNRIPPNDPFDSTNRHFISAIRDIVGPERSDYSQLDHKEKEQLVNLLLSHA